MWAIAHERAGVGGVWAAARRSGMGAARGRRRTSAAVPPMAGYPSTMCAALILRGGAWNLSGSAPYRTNSFQVNQLFASLYGCVPSVTLARRSPPTALLRIGMEASCHRRCMSAVSRSLQRQVLPSPDAPCLGAGHCPAYSRWVPACRRRSGNAGQARTPYKISTRHDQQHST